MPNAAKVRDHAPQPDVFELNEPVAHDSVGGPVGALQQELFERLQTEMIAAPRPFEMAIDEAVIQSISRFTGPLLLAMAVAAIAIAIL